jgi:outer membrane protein TolC
VGGGGGGGGGGAAVSQIGPITPNLDAVLQNGTVFSHTTNPQANQVLSQTTALVDTHHFYGTFVQQGLITGGFVQGTFNESYLKQNAPTDVLNPSVAPIAQIYVRHNFLNGFGVNVNSRFIRVGENNLRLADQTFRSQLLNLVASVLNLYWDLVGGQQDVKARRLSLELAQKFYDDAKREIELGATANSEIYRAEGELTTRKQELAIAQSTVRQQENLLKNAISRNGLEDPLLDAAEIVTLDRLEVPEREDLPPLRQLLATALAKRPDLTIARISQENAEISALGTANGVLPFLVGIASHSAGGLSGTPVPETGGVAANPYFVGGVGNALGQIFRHDFSNDRAAVGFEGFFHNRISQGDYGVDRLQLRQSELVTRRSMNQLLVDISNQVIALRQARARYSTAVNTRALEEQLLDREQRKFSLGASKRSDVIVVQRSLADARNAEVAALATYSRARVSLDQVLGETLEKNHVSISEALQGQVSRESSLPEIPRGPEPRND